MQEMTTQQPHLILLVFAPSAKSKGSIHISFHIRISLLHRQVFFWTDIWTQLYDFSLTTVVIIAAVDHIFYLQGLHIFSSLSALFGNVPKVHGRPNSVGKHGTSYHVRWRTWCSLKGHSILMTSPRWHVLSPITGSMKLPLQKGSIYLTTCRQVVTLELCLCMFWSQISLSCMP